MDYLKFVDGSDELIEGMLAPHGGIFNGRDVEGEFFSDKTDFVLDLFSARPVMYHHGLDPDVDIKAVGRIDELKHTDKGLWMRAQLDKRSEYYDAIKQMIGEKALELSSGSLPHLIRKGKSGEILRWPVVEGSLTPTAACPGLATVDFATAKAHFKSAGIEVDFDALKAKLDAAAEADLPDSDVTPTDVSDDAAKSATPAGIKSMEGSYEDLIDDLTSLLNPATPFGDGCYTCILATYPTYVIAQRYDYDSDSDDSYWQVEYSIGDDGDPVLGKATPVEQTYVPAKSYNAESPITLDAQLLSRHAGAFSQRTQDLGERRIAAGRPLSTSNRASVATAIDRLEGAKTALQSTVDASDHLQHDQAEATARMQPDSLQRRLDALDLVIDTAPA